MKIEILKRPRLIAGVTGRASFLLAAFGLVGVIAVQTARAQSLVDTLGGGRAFNASEPDSGYRDGTPSKYNFPAGLAVNGDGSKLFIADTENSAIRTLNLSNNLAGTFANTNKSVNRPVSVLLDAAGSVYVLNRGNGNNGSILKFTAAGTLIRTNAAGLVNAAAMALDGSTNLYVIVQGNTVMRFGATATNVVAVIPDAGTSLRGIAIMDTGLLALSDGGNHGLWLLDPANGTKTILTGFNGAGDVSDEAAYAQFNQPDLLAKAGNGFIVVSDRGNHRIKVVDPSGFVSVLYGVDPSYWVDHHDVNFRPGWHDGPGIATPDFGSLNYSEARDPRGVAVGPSGDIFTTENFYHIVRKVTQTGLTGPSGSGSGGTNVVTVPAPTLSPNSGYFPMGRIITVSSPNPEVHYTMDGTIPTQASPTVPMNGNTGFIRWVNSTNDLTALRVRVFIGTNASVTVSGQPATANSVGVPAGLGGPLLAGIGSKIVVPVVADLRTNDSIKSYIFRIEVTPNGGAPMISDQFDALTVASNDFIRVVTAAKEGAIGILGVQPYTNGSTRGLSLTAIGTNANMSFQHFGVVALVAIPIPATAQVGQTYTINILNSSATSDGGQAAVLFPAKPATTLLVTNLPYTVGDSARGGWYNAGDFGNHDLDNADVNNAFYAATGLRIPYTFSDVYDSMDAWPPDELGFLGGDGQLAFLDWQVTLQRALGLDSQNWLRAWSSGGDRTNNSTTLIPGGSPDGGGTSLVGSPWNRQALISALPVGGANPGAQIDVPVYLRAASGVNVKGFQFRCMITPDNGGPALAAAPTFIPAAGIAGPNQGSSQPNEVACGWSLNSVSFGSHTSNYLGTIRFLLPANAALSQTYSIAFANAGGALDIHTPYSFETKRATIAVAAPVAPVTDITSDDWKLFFFGSLTDPVASPNADGDHDGVANWAEYTAGTDPTDALSSLKFDSSTSRIVNNQRQVVLNWLSAPGKTYEVLDGSTPGNPAESLLGTVIGDGTMKQFTVLNPAGSRFYRLRVQP